MKTKEERQLKKLGKRKRLSKREKVKLRNLKNAKKEEEKIVSFVSIKKEDSFDLAGGLRQLGQKNVFRFHLRGGR